MPETLIELDLSSPWEPPEPPRVPLRFKPLPRWVTVATVLAVAAGVLAAAGAPPRTGPRYRVEHQVLNAIVAGDMLFVARYRQEAAADPQVEGRRLSDGKLLWSVPTDLQQHYAAASADALILIRHSTADRGYSSTLTALDPATGRELWTRPDALLISTRDGLIVVEDMIEPGEDIQIVVGEEPDLTVNHAADARPRQVHVLDERTGTAVWELTAPSGAVLTYTWDGQYPAGHVTGVDQLDPSGLVTRRDIRTGAVVATRQLDWSGTPAMFDTGAAWLAAPGKIPSPAAGRAVVYPDGERGGIVFDLADGRTLFRTDRAIYDGLYQCAAALFCATGGSGSGIIAYDSTTGRSVWQLDDYTQVLATAGDRLVVSTFEQSVDAVGRLGVVDARTGALIEKVTEWRVIMGASAERIVLWRPVDDRTAVLAELDPATGWITVFGRAGDWYGPPECSAEGDTLACVMVGELTVWRLPAR